VATAAGPSRPNLRRRNHSACYPFVERIGGAGVLSTWGVGRVAFKAFFEKGACPVGGRRGAGAAPAPDAVRLFDGRPAPLWGGSEPWPRSPSATSPKRYGATLAVDDMTFTVGDNEFFCLSGPPLRARPRCCRLILGLERPDSGEILIDGRPMTQVSPAERHVAMVLPDLALFPHMTARGDVRFPLEDARVSGARPSPRAVREVAAKLHIGPHPAQAAPPQLSVGNAGWPSRARWCATQWPS
jgi:hypothetical protein